MEIEKQKFERIGKSITPGIDRSHPPYGGSSGRRGSTTAPLVFSPPRVSGGVLSPRVTLQAGGYSGTPPKQQAAAQASSAQKKVLGQPLGRSVADAYSNCLSPRLILSPRTSSNVAAQAQASAGSSAPLTISRQGGVSGTAPTSVKKPNNRAISMTNKGSTREDDPRADIPVPASLRGK